MEDQNARGDRGTNSGAMARGGDTVAGGGEQDGPFVRFAHNMASDGKMQAVAVDGVASEVEIALAIPCFILCAMCPQVRNLAGVEDVLLSFVHDTAPSCGIDCVKTHPDCGRLTAGEIG